MIIRRINHKYKNFELDIKNLEIENNKIIGLIGENGAGKTTLMDILSKMIKANASFDVQDYNENDILYIPSQVSPYYFLTVSEFCKIVNEYSPSNKTSEDLIVELGLEDKKDTLISELSEGMKKKLTLINILTGDYSLIIMDEPFNSIDLKYSYEIKKLILQLKENSTILISSHILDSLIDICDEFVLLKNGKVKKYSPIQKIKSNWRTRFLREIFRLDMKLRFKEIKIDRLSGAIQFILIISAIFLFLKYLSSLPSDHYVIKALFAFFLAFMGFFKIRTDSITQREMNFMTFFPKFNKVQVRKYFMYKKATITYIFIIYLLFPTSVEILEIKSFFMYGSIIYFYMFVDTLFFYLTENTRKSNILYTALRISYYVLLFSSLNFPNLGIDLEKLLPKLQLWYMIPIFVVLFCVNPLLLKAPNIKGE